VVLTGREKIDIDVSKSEIELNHTKNSIRLNSQAFQTWISTLRISL
jgi:hypothetical protein